MLTQDHLSLHKILKGGNMGDGWVYPRKKTNTMVTTTLVNKEESGWGRVPGKKEFGKSRLRENSRHAHEVLR